jgi:hypothetical protein
MGTQNHLKQSDLGKSLDPSVHLLVSNASYSVRVSGFPSDHFFSKIVFCIISSCEAKSPSELPGRELNTVPALRLAGALTT